MDMFGYKRRHFSSEYLQCLELSVTTNCEQKFVLIKHNDCFTFDESHCHMSPAARLFSPFSAISL